MSGERAGGQHAQKSSTRVKRVRRRGIGALTEVRSGGCSRARDRSPSGCADERSQGRTASSHRRLVGKLREALAVPVRALPATAPRRASVARGSAAARGEGARKPQAGIDSPAVDVLRLASSSELRRSARLDNPVVSVARSGVTMELRTLADHMNIRRGSTRSSRSTRSCRYRPMPSASASGPSATASGRASCSRRHRARSRSRASGTAISRPR